MEVQNDIDNMDVSENRGIQKWMVKIMENPIKMDDFGGNPTIFGNTHMLFRPNRPADFEV